MLELLKSHKAVFGHAPFSNISHATLRIFYFIYNTALINNFSIYFILVCWLKKFYFFMKIYVFTFAKSALFVEVNN